MINSERLGAVHRVLAEVGQSALDRASALRLITANIEQKQHRAPKDLP